MREIATELGVSHQRVHAMLKKELGRLNAIRKKMGERITAVELRTLERLQDALWDEAMGGEVPAVLAILKIMDHRATLLGLKAAQKVEVTQGSYDAMSEEQLIEEAKKRSLLPPHVIDVTYTVQPTKETKDGGSSDV